MSAAPASDPAFQRKARWRVAVAVGTLLGLFVLADSFIRLSGNPNAAGAAPFVAEHGNIGAALVNGEGFSNPFGTPSGPTAWVPPVFPLYMAAVFSVFGVKTAAALKALLALDALFAGVAGAATCLVLDFAGRPSAKLPFALVWAGLHLLDGYVGGLTLATFAFVAAENAALLACACGAYYEGTAGWKIGLAVLAGLIPVTHAGSGAASTVIVALFAVSAARRARRGGAGPGAAFMRCFDYAALPALCFLFTVGLWTARNYREFGHFVPLKSAGWFEVYLTQAYTEDGVLDDAVMLGHHPFSNPKLLVDYTLNGEALFLKEFEIKARAAVAADRPKYWRGILGRAENVFSYCSTTPSEAYCPVEKNPVDARQIVGADLAARLTLPVPIWWTSLKLPPEEFHERLYALDIGGKPALEADWLGSKQAMLETAARPSRVLLALSLAGLPSMAILLTLLLGGARLGLPIAAAWIFFVVAQLPNVLITHYAAHSEHFRSFHALAIGLLLTLLWERVRARTRSV